MGDWPLEHSLFGSRRLSCSGAVPCTKAVVLCGYCRTHCRFSGGHLHLYLHVYGGCLFLWVVARYFWGLYHGASPVYWRFLGGVYADFIHEYLPELFSGGCGACGRGVAF